jgi:signal transduction histidine kinase
MKSPAVSELQEYVRFCIDWATIYRDYWIKEDKKNTADKAREEFEESIQTKTNRYEVIKAAATHIQDQISRLVVTPSEDERQNAAKTISPSIEAILAQDQANEIELHHLRLIASSSTLLLIFSHEVKSFLSDIDNIEGIVSRLSKFSQGLIKIDLEKLNRQLSDSKTRFEQLLELTALVGVDARKFKPMRLSLLDRVERAVSCFALVINSYSVKVDISEIPSNLLVGPMLEAELYAILLNALSNSLKSVIAVGASKNISISAERINNKTKILISDTGIGLDNKRYNEVFTPFVADPEGDLYSKLDVNLNPADKYIVGTGSGLGLSIIKEIVTRCNGSVRFVRPERNWKAQLEVLLP